MNCKNCGGRIRKGDSYCPGCGMELLVSEYKPLQKKYMRGEYQDEDDFLLGDDNFYAGENEDYHRNYQNHEDTEYEHSQRYSRYGQNRYDARHETAEQGRGHDHVYEQKESSSGWLLIVLFLVIALMVGFVIGLIMYSSKLIFH